MKYELGRCLLQERLRETGLSLGELAAQLRYKPERLADFMANQRVIPLKDAISIAASLGCGVNDLYELKSIP